MLHCSVLMVVILACSYEIASINSMQVELSRILMNKPPTLLSLTDGVFVVLFECSVR